MVASFNSYISAHNVTQSYREEIKEQKATTRSSGKKAKGYLKSTYSVTLDRPARFAAPGCQALLPGVVLLHGLCYTMSMLFFMGFRQYEVCVSSTGPVNNRANTQIVQEKKQIVQKRKH
jgi:hypothetical protein